MNLFRRSFFAASCALGWLPLHAQSESEAGTAERPRSLLDQPVFGNQPQRDPDRVFFPPTVPVFGVDPRTSPARGGRGGTVEPPNRLGEFVGEFFYPALSTRLFGRTLDDKTNRRLEAYLAERRNLLNEIQNALVTAHGLEPAARERSLQAFAATQGPRLAAHESEAEKIRQQLIEGSLIRDGVNWSRDRDWNVRALPAGSSRLEATAQFQVLRAAAYYQNGLIPEQRGLLVEIAEEASAARNRARAEVREDRPVSSVYFSPEMARLPIPAVSADLSARIYAYLRARDALKDELREAVLANDGASASRREAIFTRLAEAQWPRLSELALEADQLRRELAAVPPPPRPPLPPRLPPTLVARIEALNADRRAFEAERIAAITLDDLDPSLAETTERSVRNGGRRTDAAAELQERRKQAEAKFLEAHAAQAAELERRMKTLQTEITIFAQSYTDPATGRPMEVAALFNRIRETDRYFEQIAREETLYQDYRTALLEPGLSPEQRRLLLNAARVTLAQALPTGELFPTGDRPRFGR